MNQSKRRCDHGFYRSDLEKNPEENAPKLMAWVDRLAGSGPVSFEPQRDAFRKVLADPNNNMYQLMMHVMHDVDTDGVSECLSIPRYHRE